MVEFKKAWEKEEQQPFSGWDFSYLEGRMVEEQPPWSYPERAAGLMRSSASLLDIGTGGGERLLELHAEWPSKVVATEDYPPNFKLAGERLGPLGVKIVDLSSPRAGLWPFENGEFDLILNRQSKINCTESARVLAPGGSFLTQQIHGLWARDLLAALDAAPAWPEARPEYHISRLEAAGLTIKLSKDWQGQLIFHDVGAVVYYLKAVPWLVPGFSVGNHLNNLMRLQVRLQREGALVFEARTYLIEAGKTS